MSTDRSDRSTAAVFLLQLGLLSFLRLKAKIDDATAKRQCVIYFDSATVSLLRKLLLKKSKTLNVQTAVWFKKAKISNFNFQKRRKFFSYHAREGF